MQHRIPALRLLLHLSQRDLTWTVYTRYRGRPAIAEDHTARFEPHLVRTAYEATLAPSPPKTDETVLRPGTEFGHLLNAARDPRDRPVCVCGRRYRRPPPMTTIQTVGSTKRGLSTVQLARQLGIDTRPSSLVEIDWRQVDALSRHIAQDRAFAEFEPAAWEDDQFWNVGDAASKRSQFFAIGNSINFRFWSIEDGRMRPATGTLDGTSYRGAMYMWRALRRALQKSNGNLLRAEYLAQLTENDFDVIFSDDEGSNPLSIARGDRIANLRDLGTRLLRAWDGEFLNVAEASDRSLVRFADLSRTFRAFDDPIYKLTMVNAILHSGSGVYAFADEPLPAIDYHLLKQALRQGLIRPAHELADKLMRGLLLSASEALDLRRLALEALVGVSERTHLSGEILDNKYWLNRLKCRDRDPVCLDAATAHECPFFGTCTQATDFELPLELTRYY